MSQQRFRGAGGKKPKNPTYTNDSLFSEDSIELLLAVGEGPIFGLQNGKQSFFVGDVPLQRIEASVLKDNFTNLRVNPNSIGDSQDINKHQGLPKTINVGMGLAADIIFQKQGESASVDVGTQVLYATPVIRYTPSNMRGRIQHLEVRVNIAQLSREDENGSFPHTAKFRIEYKKSLDATWLTHDPVYSFTHLPTSVSLVPQLSDRDGLNEYALTGKTGSGFIIDFKIPTTLTTDDDWMIRVTKNNPDYVSSASATKEIAEIIFDSFQMIGNATRKFPDTAVIQITGTASDQFSSLPDFYGIYKGLMTPVPKRYLSEPINLNPYRDPLFTWTGELELAYHSNPAWVLYDLLDNVRYGYRKYVSDLVLNKNDFYEAGRWCDEMVAGKIGQERRYTMNITIAENQNAWEYLQNIAGAFDGILYDDGEGTVRLKVDRWVNPKVIFTPETINAEGFSYSFTDVATQYNELTVSFSNPERGWEESRLQVVYDDTDNGRSVNGAIPLDFVAVGCISESEAVRRGRVRGLTASTENTLVNFTTTRLGLALDPLEIFYVSDPYMNWGQTGRAEVISGLNIYLRDELPFTVADLSQPYTMRIQTLSDLLTFQVLLTSPTSLLVTGTSTETDVFLAASFAEFPVFVLSGGRLKCGEPKPFRATTLEPLNNYNLFQISGLEVNPKKFDFISSSEHLELTIDRNQTSGLNLRQFVEASVLTPVPKYLTATITLDGTGDELYIVAADVNSYALTVGDWSDILPVGVKPKVVVKGGGTVHIVGRGGRGGNGGGLIGLDVTGGGLSGHTLPPDYGFPVEPSSIMGGLAGQNGGPAANFEQSATLEIEPLATLNIVGGYGGGYGGDGAYVTVPAYLTGFGIRASADRAFSIFRTVGAGGSGGRPLGAFGSAGAANYGVPNGDAGTLIAGGVCPAVTPHPVAQTGLLVLHGEGRDGLNLPDTNNPAPGFVIDPTDGYTTLRTYAGSRVNGTQGVAITNIGNLDLINNGSLVVTP
jgi:hypothetical protein